MSTGDGREWRVLPMEMHDAATNMAIDEAVSEAVAAGDVRPTIRFYRWEPSAVSIGRFQSLADEVDRAACDADGVDVVRRRTGGGAVYHDTAGEVTYSVVGPEAAFPSDIEDSYRDICDRVVDGLDRLGIDATFAPVNDVVADGRKCSGSAQTRRDGVLLQHGTVLHRVDPERMFTYLHPDIDKVSDKHVSSARERVTSVVDLAGETGIEETYAALCEGFTAGRETVVAELTEAERKRASELRLRYLDPDWTAER
jgi:lipoate-protein ligase A